MIEHGAAWNKPHNSLRPRQNIRHFCRQHFQVRFLEWNVWIPTKVSLKFVPESPINQYSSIVSENGLAPSRRQAIIWNTDGYFTDAYIYMYVCVCVPLGTNVLKTHFLLVYKTYPMSMHAGRLLAVAVKCLFHYKDTSDLFIYFHLHLLYQPYVGLCQTTCVQSYQRWPSSAVAIATCEVQISGASFLRTVPTVATGVCKLLCCRSNVTLTRENLSLYITQLLCWSLYNYAVHAADILSPTIVSTKCRQHNWGFWYMRSCGSM